MSLESIDYLIDLLQELDDKFVVNSVDHPDSTRTHLDDLGSAAYEMAAQIIDVAGSATLNMRTQMDDVHLVRIKVRSNDDTGLWGVSMDAGNKTDELNINHIIGELKEIYG